jgi:hypothetical protein
MAPKALGLEVSSLPHIARLRRRSLLEATICPHGDSAQQRSIRELAYAARELQGVAPLDGHEQMLVTHVPQTRTVPQILCLGVPKQHIEQMFPDPSSMFSHTLLAAQHVDQMLVRIEGTAPDLASEASVLLTSYTEQSHHVMTRRERCEKTGINRRRIANKTSLLAASLMFVDHLFRLSLERQVTALDHPTPLGLTAYFEYNDYDETSILMRVKDSMFCLTVCPEGPPPASSTIDGQIVGQTFGMQLVSESKLAIQLGPSSSVAKIFQTHHYFGLLLSYELDGAKHFIGIVGTQVPSLSLMERNNAACMKASLANSTYVSLFSGRFGWEVRHATTDKFGANFVAEQSLLSDRGNEWHGTHKPCDVHVVAVSLTRTSALIDVFVSGCLNVYLSITGAGHLSCW